jgi:hypothetical protein
MKTYIKIIDDIVVYVLKSATEQPDLIEIDFDIGKSDVAGQVFKYSTRSWIDNRTEDEKSSILISNIKNERGRLLQASDWTDTFSAPARLGQEIYHNWQAYRQALRDITAQPGYPFNIIWPTPPQG